MSVLHAVLTWGRMVRFSHSVFALPFALAGAALAAAEHGIRGAQVFWIVVAMIGARNAAMGFNRLADHEIDADNPRTAGRALPRGLLTRRAVWVFTAALSALFVFAAFRLGTLCGALSPLALAVVLGYSYAKRFTWTSHLLLGLALAMAPLGGWLGVAGHVEPPALLLATAVLLWVAGFDVVYACQDLEFDRRTGLHSVPARFGTARALMLARLMHAAALAALAAVGGLTRLHPVYWVGWFLVAAVLAWQHRLLRADNLAQAGAAFLDRNGLVGVLYLASVLAALLAPRLG